MGSPRDVRLTPNSGGIADIPALRVCAMSRHGATTEVRQKKKPPQGGFNQCGDIAKRVSTLSSVSAAPPAVVRLVRLLSRYENNVRR
jgi:hypothetical protein